MEKLEVFDCNDIMIASFFTNDRGCAHENREHTLIYIVEGELDILHEGKHTVLHKGDCAFMRRDNHMWLQKHASTESPYRSVVLKFNRQYLKDYYQQLRKRDLPLNETRERSSLKFLGSKRPEFTSLFESILPYFDAGITPSDEVLQLKMREGLEMLLNMDARLYASLFDFIDPWKIDILEFMEKNYMEDLTMEEMASYTGRSLSTFKRDFKKYTNLTPQRWITTRRLHAAHELLCKGGQRVTDVCYKVGFKNLSHFSKIYKEAYGLAPNYASAVN